MMDGASTGGIEDIVTRRGNGETPAQPVVEAKRRALRVARLADICREINDHFSQPQRFHLLNGSSWANGSRTTGISRPRGDGASLGT